MAYPLDPALHKWQAHFTTPHAAKKHANGPNGEWEYRVYLRAIQHSFHPAMADVKVWTFGNGLATDTWPGVTIEAKTTVPARVTFVNNLVGENIHSLMKLGTRQGMEEDHMVNQVSHNQVHLHGARVPWTSDGSPMNVFHPHETRGYYYPNQQAAATLWYHDHSMDVTRLNVYAGLAGAYLLRDPAEAGHLPEGEFEVPMVLQDRSFTPVGEPLRLHYAQQIDVTSADAIAANAPIATPEFLGDYPVVNGKIWPKMQAKCAVYRWRLINGANTRYFKLSLGPKADASAAARVAFHIIGTDGGLLPSAQQLKELVLAPGERADILVDLTGQGGQELVLRNAADIPYPGANQANPDFPCNELLLVHVGGSVVSGQDKFKPGNPAFQLPQRTDPLPGGNLAGIPAAGAIDAAINAHLLATEGASGQLVPIDHASLSVAALVPFNFTYRRFVLEEYQIKMPTLKGVAAPPNPIGAGVYTDLRVPTVLINGKDGKKAKPVVTNKDDYEVWEFVNLTPDSHPMHIHLVQFHVLSRYNVTKVVDTTRPVSARLPEPFRADGYGPAGVVQGYEASGWKDTVPCEPDQVTRMLMRFDGYSGEYVYHCHILEHEDMGMMFDLRVEP
jgi:spore coat protein A, manganese oxidase